MKLIAFANDYKQKDTQPDFTLNLKDASGEIVKENYTKKDGTQGVGSAKVGALWVSKTSAGKQYMNIDLDTAKIKELMGGKAGVTQNAVNTVEAPTPQPTQPIDNTQVDVAYDNNGNMQVVGNDPANPFDEIPF